MQTQDELQVLTVDLKAALASGTVAPHLPGAILATAALWLKADPKTPPSWQAFDLDRLGEAAAYASVLRCHNDMIFTFVHAGARLTALLGEELIGRTINYATATVGEIDWYRRCRPVAQSAEVRVLSGRTNPPYTTGFEFIAADFPFLGKQGEVSHILGITVPPLN
jgi:hypothetical protein